MPKPISKPQVDLVAGFLGPWETDYQEVDGNRSYAVFGHRNDLLSQGLSVDDVDRASTVAALIVHGEQMKDINND